MGRNHQALDKVRAPYRFVPLGPVVELGPEEARDITHDVPFSDGICGQLNLKLTAETPLFIRGSEDKTRFFQTPYKQVAIPGTSLRGMLRSVVEIAAFARLRRVNDHRYGVRDLHNRDLYGQHMAVIDPRSKKPTPLVCSGWLTRTDDPENPAILTPCDFAKIHYRELKALAQSRGVRGFEPGKKQSAPEKYGAWSASREVAVSVGPMMESNPRGSVPRVGAYGVVKQTQGRRGGELVFTGQPSNWSETMVPKGRGAGNPKQHDFVFLEPLRPILPIKVSRQVYEDFRFVHSDGGQQHRKTISANAELKHWLDQTNWENGGTGRIPVFFLLDERGKLRAMGLAMMFRLAYRHSTRDAVENVQGPDRGAWDLADAIFGHIPDSKGTPDRREAAPSEQGLRGRVSIGLGLLAGGYEALDDVTAVLGSPKASYYPNYVEQSADPEQPGSQPPRRAGKPVYSTYMDDGVRARGWKRYLPASHAIKEPPLPTRSDGTAMSLDKVGTRFRPIQIRDGSYFSIPVRVHNLRPFELGALLWALDFGENPKCRHTLGMAKSLGYGTVRLEVERSLLETVRGEDVDLSACRRAFAAEMERRLRPHRQPGGWAGSRQLFELIAAAIPQEPQRHMQIKHSAFGNEFQAAKKQGMALSTAGDPADWIAPPLEPGPTPELARRPTPTPPVAQKPEPAPEPELEPVLSPDETDTAALQEARTHGKHAAMLRAWMEEGGEREAARRKIARAVIGTPSKKMRKRAPELVAWLVA